MRHLASSLLATLVISAIASDGWAWPKRHKHGHGGRRGLQGSLDLEGISLNRDKLKAENNEYDLSPLFDPCAGVRCASGYECNTTLTGFPKCVCATRCAPHYKPVCGSDGVFYENHCELHRAACVARTRIFINHDRKCFEAEEDEEEEEEEGLFKEEEGEKEEQREAYAEDDVDDEYDSSTEITSLEAIWKEDDVGENKASRITGAASTGPVSKPALSPVGANEANDVGAKKAAPKVAQRLYLEIQSCNEKLYEDFKDRLLQYYSAKAGDLSYKDKRGFDFVALLALVFKTHDTQRDGRLSQWELNQAQKQKMNDMRELSEVCSMSSLIQFDDTNKDTYLDKQEFFTAFGYFVEELERGPQNPSLTRAKVGDNIEMRCDIRRPKKKNYGNSSTKESNDDKLHIVWRRSGVDLSQVHSDDIKVFANGALYITDVNLHHMGNFSCHATENPKIIQTHVLQVVMPPRVQVTTSAQNQVPGHSVSIQCHAVGLPTPRITWLRNYQPMAASSLLTPLESGGGGVSGGASGGGGGVDRNQNRENGKNNFYLWGKNSHLEFRSVNKNDSGTYMCQARNSAGSGADVTSLFVERGTNVARGIEGVFYIFGRDGVQVYEPHECMMARELTRAEPIKERGRRAEGAKAKPVKGILSSILPSSSRDYPRTRLCPRDSCSWGDVVNVKDRYLYATQPEDNRIVVIDIRDQVVVESIATDAVPVKLWYIEHLDQIWVLCWGSMNDVGSKTLQVIREASTSDVHNPVHTQPVGNQFDLIQNAFLPGSNDFRYPYQYGYVMHSGQEGLMKLHLETMKYVETIDLKAFNCVPKTLDFSPLGGAVFIQCADASIRSQHFQIVMDMITSQVTEIHNKVTGSPHVSPDGRHVVSLEAETVSVQNVRAGGDGDDDGDENEEIPPSLPTLQMAFEIHTDLHVSGIAFVPSQSGSGYDVFISSVDKGDVLFVNLLTGKVELLTGVKRPPLVAAAPWETAPGSGRARRTNDAGQTPTSPTWAERPLVASGVFGQFLVTPAAKSVFFLNQNLHKVQCEVGEVNHGNVIAWTKVPAKNR